MMSTASMTRRVSVLRTLVTDHQINATLQMTTTASASPASCPKDGVDKDNAPPAKPYNTIPGPGGVYNLPFIGFLFHMKPFGKFTTETMHHLFDDMIERYGPIFKIRTNFPTVVITDPKDLAAMLRNEGKYPFRPNFDLLEVYYRRTGNRPNVGALQGPDWWKVRAPMQKTLLRPREVSQYLPLMNGVADDFVQMLLSGYLETHEAEEAFMTYMAESAGAAFFNKRLGFLDKNQSEETRKMQQATFDMFDLIHKSMVGTSNSYRFFRSKDYLTFESAVNYLRNKTVEFVRSVKDDIDAKKALGIFNADEPNMLLSFLKDSTEEEATLIMEGLYFASIDSSASVLQVALYTLAKHPDKQEKLREEIFSVISGMDGSNSKDNDNNMVTQEHLDRMPYLKACVKEVYRCWGVVLIGPVRVLPVDVVLGGYHVPAGVQVYNYNARACRDETVFENPYNYEPERWLRQSKKKETDPETGGGGSKGDKDSSWAVLPFGLGPRSCPGRRLFEQELYLLLVKLLQNMRVGIKPESEDVDFEYRLFLKSVKPLKFTFTPLNVRE